MRNTHLWMATHVSVVVAHIGMGALVLTALFKIFVDESDEIVGGSLGRDNARVHFPSSIHESFGSHQQFQVIPSSFGHNFQRQALFSGVSSFTTKFVLLIAAHLVTFFGNISNIILSLFIYRLEHARFDDSVRTLQAHFAKQQLAFYVFAVFNLGLALADISLAGLMARFVRQTSILAAPVTMAAVAGLITLTSIFIDLREYRVIHQRFKDIMRPNPESIALIDEFEDNSTDQ